MHNPHKVAQAGCTFEQAILGIENPNTENLQSFMDNEDDPLRQAVIARFTKMVVVEKPKLLQFSHNFRLPAVPLFVPKDHFKVDTSDTAELKISYIGLNLKALMKDQTEKAVPEITTGVSKLLRQSSATDIKEAVGQGKEVFLAHVHSFLKTADKRNWYLFFIEGTDSVVDADWRGSGWDLDAYSVSGPYEWDVGGWVVSREVL